MNDNFTRPRPNAFWFSIAILVGCWYFIIQQFYHMYYYIIDNWFKRDK